jgi:hypothetical protein
MPLIDVLDHVDFPIIETESPKFFDAIFIDIGVSVNLHGVPSVSSRWPVDHTGYIIFSSLRQSGFVESFMRPLIADWTTSGVPRAFTNLSDN